MFKNQNFPNQSNLHINDFEVAYRYFWWIKIIFEEFGMIWRTFDFLKIFPYQCSEPRFHHFEKVGSSRQERLFGEFWHSFDVIRRGESNGTSFVQFGLCWCRKRAPLKSRFWADSSFDQDAWFMAISPFFNLSTHEKRYIGSKLKH